MTKQIHLFGKNGSLTGFYYKMNRSKKIENACVNYKACVTQASACIRVVWTASFYETFRKLRAAFSKPLTSSHPGQFWHFPLTCINHHFFSKKLLKTPKH